MHTLKNILIATTLLSWTAWAEPPVTTPNPQATATPTVSTQAPTPDRPAPVVVGEQSRRPDSAPAPRPESAPHKNRGEIKFRDF